jgi:alpha-galactosidase
MQNDKMMKITTTIAALAVALGAHPLVAAPLKVYLMAGQSNMQGHCKLTTFPYLAMDSATAPMLKKMVDHDGTPRVIENVWISSLGTGDEEKFGKLTAGFGAERSGPKIGPELTFGISMQEHLGEPVLLIKTSWGGVTLCYDFRPPSAGLHSVQAQRLEELRKNNGHTKKAEAEYNERAGNCYRQMIAHAKSVLADIKRVVPDYDPAQGYELAGFVWLQGESDFGNTETYPTPGQPGGYDEYSRLLACLIRDIRKDLNAPEMRTVIGVLGFNGELETERPREINPDQIPWLREFRKAMAAPAAMPEFKGKVAAVPLEKFWDPKLEELQCRWQKVKDKSRELKGSKLGNDDKKAAIDAFLKTVYSPEEWKLMEIGVSNATYHYLGSAKIMARMGKAFADAMADLSK